MTTVEVHVPVTLNEPFALMSQVLVKSLLQNAALPGRWSVVFTCSRDSTIGPDSPLLSWTKDFDVTFRWVEQALWDSYGYNGTGLQQHLYRYDADVVLIMDADTVVTGSLREVVEHAASTRTVAAWPAWQPPAGVDWPELFTHRGLAYPEQAVTYSGYGFSFMSPRSGPPYFNYGFVAAHRSIITTIGTTMGEDLDQVWRNCNRTWFSSQIALTLSIARHQLDFIALPLQYNCSNGDYDAPEITNDVADRIWAEAVASLPDTRVLHYCVPGPEFVREVDMRSLDSFDAFCRRTVTGEGSLRLQRAFRALEPLRSA